MFETVDGNDRRDALLAGGGPRVVGVKEPGWEIDPDELSKAFNNRTRAIVINTPTNPTGKVFTRAELQMIADLCQKWDVLAIADEIYEHMVYDGVEHQSVARFPELAARSVVVSSFGTTYPVTGRKVGYAAGPAARVPGFRKVHQFNVFTLHTPIQHGPAPS